MRRGHGLILLLLAAGLGAAVWLMGVELHQRKLTAAALPTLVIWSSLTPSPTLTASPSPTSTSTATDTPTSVPSPTPTASPTLTPTLAVRVLAISAVMPGVDMPPTPTDFPFGTILLPAPPLPAEPLPDATNDAPPYRGWYSFESDHPLVQYSAPWEPRLHTEASRGKYHRSEDAQRVVTFQFEGEGLRIRYVAARNMGVFEVIVDGVVVDTVDAYAPELQFLGTRVYFVGSGAHTLTLRSAGRRNAQSEGYAVGLDAVQVFRSPPNTLILPQPAHSPTSTPQPRPAVSVALVAAPPTVQPTPTLSAPRLMTISVVIAYDENGSRTVDPAEGVAGVSVRVVEAAANRVMAQAFTNEQGLAQLQVVTSTRARVVVPYFGRSWDVPSQRGGGQAAFTLLLPPGNQPGFIP